MSSVDLGPAHTVLEELHPVDHGHVLPLLQASQDSYGYLPREVLLEVSERTGIPASHFYGIATFYARFHFEEHGRHDLHRGHGPLLHHLLRR